MGPLDTAAQAASLDNDYGANHGAGSPTTFNLELWAGDPGNGGVQMDSVGGYAPAPMANNGTNFPATDTSTGTKTCAVQTFATPTAAWTAGGVAADADYWLLRDPATGHAWDYAAIEAGSEISVSAAGGAAPTVQPVIFYGGLQ